ncbi:MAG TPA: hypothetical protein VGO52_01305 [Hyphomonadaceae bacterium]|nr:hypothetical protein [Hyphomonadaceae bacterium]
MKGLTLTILLAVLEIIAVMSNGSGLMTDGPSQVAPGRREEVGIQSEVLVDAERPEIVELGQAEAATDSI